MTELHRHCLSGGGTTWRELPAPHSEYGMRSDGGHTVSPFAKQECNACGLVQRWIETDGQAINHFYTDSYDLYNNRPEAERFETGRYLALAQTVVDAVESFSPRRVLEVGCGNGRGLEALQTLWPQATIVGIEPRVTAVRDAQSRGLPVYQGALGDILPSEAAPLFDVIYSLHVIEHSPDPVDFLRAMKALLAPSGKIVITCPNACVPNAEILHADHLFSMTPYHLEVFFQRAGLLPLRAGACAGAGGREYEFNQFIAARTADPIDPSLTVPVPSYLAKDTRLTLTAARIKYLSAWNTLDQTLAARVGSSKAIYCFGTGGWAGMLAGYAPELWKRVRGCIVDGGSTHRFQGKPIFDSATIEQYSPEVIVMGVNPTIQDVLAKRFQQTTMRAVTWHDVAAG